MAQSYTFNDVDKHLNRLVKHIEIDDEGYHWIWDSALDKDGYAIFCLGTGRNGRAARLVYIHEVGPIPSGMEIDHLCRRRDCVNPAHLEAVTHKVNCQRAVAARKLEKALQV